MATYSHLGNGYANQAAGEETDQDVSIIRWFRVTPFVKVYIYIYSKVFTVKYI